MSTDLKEKTDSNTIIVGNFNTPLSSMNRASRQQVNKEALALNSMLDQRDLTFPGGHTQAALAHTYCSNCIIKYLFACLLFLPNYKLLEHRCSSFSSLYPAVQQNACHLIGSHMFSE